MLTNKNKNYHRVLYCETEVDGKPSIAMPLPWKCISGKCCLWPWLLNL